jgi:hypothetical protein
VDSGVACRFQGGDGARVQDTVLPDQGPVEIARDRGDVAGEVVRKRY